jgi:hypothetical protein
MSDSKNSSSRLFNFFPWNRGRNLRAYDGVSDRYERRVRRRGESGSRAREIQGPSILRENCKSAGVDEKFWRKSVRAQRKIKEDNKKSKKESL